MDLSSTTLAVIIALIITLVIIVLYVTCQRSQRAKCFYEVSEVYPELTHIPHDEIAGELTAVIQSPEWVDWPERNLWDAGPASARWTVFPLVAFGRRVARNCERMPELMKFIDEIDRTHGVKIAILSRLGPGMKLVPHQGWGSHSNNVLRCHYGLVVPAPTRENGRVRDCRIEVADELTDVCTVCGVCSENAGGVYGENAGGTESDNITKCNKCYDGYVYSAMTHQEKQWIVFDDSKLHMAENTTRGDRIVLILDLVRPKWIPAGTSGAEDTSELKNIIAEYSRAELG